MLFSYSKAFVGDRTIIEADPKHIASCEDAERKASEKVAKRKRGIGGKRQRRPYLA